MDDGLTDDGTPRESNPVYGGTPYVEEQQDFTEALLADDDFQALQRKTRGLIDVGSCVDTQFRASH